MFHHKHRTSAVSDDFHLVEVESAALIQPCSINQSSAALNRSGSKQLVARDEHSSTAATSLLTGPSRQGGDSSQWEAAAPSSNSSEEVFKYQGVKVRAKRTPSWVAWKPWGSPLGLCCGGPTTKRKVPFEEILSAKQLPTKACRCLSGCLCTREYKFTIYALARDSQQMCHWSLKKYVLTSKNLAVVRDWVQYINTAVQKSGDRPRQLLVFVNPHSGARQAPQVWSRVAKIFAYARIKCTVIPTTRADHARNCVQTMKDTELGQYDGVVAVGGDGLFQELVAGLLARGELLQKLRIGHIPAGSTDAVAYTLNGSRSVTTAALHIALGDRMCLDVARVDSREGQHRFYVCLAGYGFMGDVMRLSERWRWIGPVRYDIAGAFKFLQLRSYDAKVSFVRSTIAPPQLDLAQGQHVTLCGHKCSICRDPHRGVNGTGILDPFEFSVQGPGSLEACEAQADPDGGCETISSNEAWEVIEGRFVSIKVVATPCRSGKSTNGIIPHGHLADGQLYLLLVKACNHLEYLRFLITLTRKGITPGALPFVELIAVTQVRVEPTGKLASMWNVDGELMEGHEVAIRAHQGLLPVFARGVELEKGSGR